MEYDPKIVNTRRVYRVYGETGRGATPELAYTDLLGKTAEKLYKLYGFTAETKS